VNPRGFPPPKIWEWHYSQCMLRMLRAGAYAPNDEPEYEDGEEAQLQAAADKQQSTDILNTAALLDNLLRMHDGTSSLIFIVLEGKI
jgi:hypothetical protein